MMVNDHMPERRGLRFPEGDQEKKMMDPIYVYEFYVMDNGWEAFPTVETTVINLHKEDIDFDDYQLKKFLHFKSMAMRAATKARVTGGNITPVYVMPLIDNHEVSFALVWKSSKGGWCIAASERRLPWLESIDSCTLTVIDDL